MKFIKSILYISIIGLLTFSCELDDNGIVEYNGSSFVAFADVATTAVTTTENAGTLEFPFTYSNSGESEITLTLNIVDGTAVNGTHFTAPTTIVIPQGDFTATLPITLIDDMDVNDARSFDIEISSASIGGVLIGLSEEGSRKKTVTIGNDDCPTNYSVWFGAINFEDVGYGTYAATGSGLVCDNLIVEGDLPNSGQIPTNTTYTVVLTPSTPGSTTGTATVAETAFGTYNFGFDGEARYSGTGTYDETSGQIIINYQVLVYNAGVLAGSWYSGTTVITN